MFLIAGATQPGAGKRNPAESILPLGPANRRFRRQPGGEQTENHLHEAESCWAEESTMRCRSWSAPIAPGSEALPNPSKVWPRLDRGTLHAYVQSAIGIYP